MKGAQAYLCRN